MIIQCHTQVGACVVDREKDEIVGIGYNSMPYIEDGDNDTVFPWKGKHKKEAENKYWEVHPELKYAYGNYNSSNQCINLNEYIPLVVHATVNAIINKTRESLDGCTMYATLSPDKDCAHAILLAGIKEVVYRKTDECYGEQFDKMKKVLGDACKLR